MSELKVALTDVPPVDRLNPYQSNTLHIHAVIWPIYEPLFDVEGSAQDLKLIPRLGTADDWNPKGLKYVFRLRQNTGFYSDQANVQFTAQSVVDNLKRLRHAPSFRGRILSDLIKPDGVTAEDMHTVSIELNYPKPELLF